MKILVEELSEYLKAWPLGNDWYLDSDCDDPLEKSLDDNSNPITPGEVIDLAKVSTCLLYQGAGDDPGEKDLAIEIKKWRKAKTHQLLVFQVPNAAVDDVIAWVLSMKGKQVKA